MANYPKLLIGIGLALSGSAVAGCGDVGKTVQALPQLDGGPDGSVVLSAAERAALTALSPASLPKPGPDISNRFADDPRAVALGEKLFSDTSFSGPLLDTDNDGTAGALGLPGQTGKVSCASCHVPSGGFSDTRSFQRQISLGAGWGRRRAPSLLDVGQARLLMWDGRHDALYNQPFGPIESVVELNSSRLFTAERIYGSYKSEYETIFGTLPPLDDETQFPQLSASATGCQPKNKSAPSPKCDGTFHGMPGDQAEFDGLSADNQDAVTRVVVNLGKALGAYERTLSCGPSAFDAWMHGDGSALSVEAQRGAQLFVGKGACVSCHSGPFMSDQQFHNVGLSPTVVQQAFVDSDDQGAIAGIAAALSDPLNSIGKYSDGNDNRLPATTTPSMAGAFRTPTLRCVGSRPAFMHTGQLSTLARVVAFFNQGGDATGYPGVSEIHSLRLTATEQSDLVSFLEALTPVPGGGG
ncbi:MAG: cytochrome c peroxidase [Myxococcales bacterium]